MSLATLTCFSAPVLSRRGCGTHWKRPHDHRREGTLTNGKIDYSFSLKPVGFDILQNQQQAVDYHPRRNYGTPAHCVFDITQWFTDHDNISLSGDANLRASCFGEDIGAMEFQIIFLLDFRIVPRLRIYWRGTEQPTFFAQKRCPSLEC